MLDFLAAVPYRVATEAAYDASLELFMRERLGEWSDRKRWHAALRATTLPDPRTASVADVVDGVLGEIVRTERKRLRDLSDEEVEKYVMRMNRMVEESARSQPWYHHGRGEVLLKELRTEYGIGHPQSAAA